MENEKLYSPLNFHLRDKQDARDGVYDDIHYWRDELSHEEAFAYIDQIEAFLSRDRKSYDNGRGLMEYIGEGVLNDKVQSLVPSVELHGDKLWIVADVQLNEPLTPLEMANLKSFWGGQLSDGVGESWEQREIKVDCGDLYLELWTSSAGFFISTQAEFDKRFGLEKPTQAEKPSPDHDLKNQLFERLDTNLSEYCESLMSMDKRELIGMAEEVAARYAAHDYLKHDNGYDASDLAYLLKFKDPLSVVADRWPSLAAIDVSDVISDIFEKQGALRDHPLYPLVSEPSAEKPVPRGSEKPSVLAQLRDAKEHPAAEKEKPAPKKSGPEL